MACLVFLVLGSLGLNFEGAVGCPAVFPEVVYIPSNPTMMASFCRFTSAGKP